MDWEIVSQVVDEVLYTGLLEMQELDAPGRSPEVALGPTPKYMELQQANMLSRHDLGGGPPKLSSDFIRSK